MFDFFIQTLLIGLIINLIANIIWKYLPLNKLSFILLSILLIALCTIFIIFHNDGKDNITSDKRHSIVFDTINNYNFTIGDTIVSYKEDTVLTTLKNDVKIISVEELSSNKETGIGYNIFIVNNSAKEIYIKGIKLEGYAKYYKRFYPLGESYSKGKYNIIFDLSKEVKNKNKVKKTFESKEFDINSKNWFKEINGEYYYQLNADDPFNPIGNWEYSFYIPLIIKIKNTNINQIQLFINIKGKKLLNLKSNYDEIVNIPYSDLIKEKYIIKIYYSDNLILSHKISNKFLLLLSRFSKSK